MEFSTFMKNGAKTGILNHYSLSDLSNKFIIQRDDNRAFYVLNDINGYAQFHSTFKDPIFHEVILFDKPRKFFLDLDYKIRIEDMEDYNSKLNTYNAHVSCIKQCIVSVFNSTYPMHVISEADIMDVVSHADINEYLNANTHVDRPGYKFSMNLILGKYMFADQTEFANFGGLFMDMYQKYVGQSKSIVDEKFFRISCAHFIQNRIVFNTKSGELRYKFPVIDGKIETKTSIELLNAFVLQSDLGIQGKKLCVLKPLCVIEQSGRYRKSATPGLITDTFINEVLSKTQHIWKDAFVPRGHNSEVPIVYFNRTKPSYCEFCEDTHHKDNSLYFFVADTRYVYSGCLQKRDHKKLVYVPEIEIEIPSEPKTLIEKPKIVYKDWYAPLMDIGAKMHVETETFISDNAFTDDNLLLIKAEMKMGKSKSLVEYISKNNSSFKRIVFVSFRRTFTAETKTKYKELGFESYNEIDGMIDLEIHNRIIIQVESLSRLKTPIQNVDLLILDEVESIWSQFSSNNFRDFYGSFNIFDVLLRASDKTIAMDANISIRTSRIFAKLFKEMPTKTINIYVNNFNTNWDITFYLIGKGEWLTKIAKSLEDKSVNIAIFSNSLKEARILKAFVGQIVGDKAVKLYGSKTKESTKQKHFGDVDNYWSKYRCIICTPTVSAGVSFERKHFQYVFGYFTDKSCNVETCRQMLGRVRNVESKEIYITISATEAKYLTDIRHIKLALSRNRTELVKQYGSNLSLLNFRIDNITGDCSYEDNLQLTIILENIAFDNRSRNKFYHRMLNQLSGKSNKLHIESKIMHELKCNKSLVDEIKAKYSRISHQTKTSLIKDIEKADNLNEETYDELLNKSRNLCDINKDEHNAIDKFIIKRVTQLDFDDINFEIVKTFSKKQKQQALMANRSVFACESWDESIKTLIEKECRRYDEIRNRSVDTIMFKGKIHLLIREICKAFTYLNDQDGLDILRIVRSSVTLCDLGCTFDTELIYAKIIELLPMIDMPYDVQFQHKSKCNKDILFQDYIIKLANIMQRVYGFRIRTKSVGLTLLPMKDVIYVYDGERYCNGKPFIGDKKYPIVAINYRISDDVATPTCE